MSQANKLTGLRFGKWIVLGLHPVHHRNRLWDCRCDCGTERAVFGGSLKSGASASCGCTIGLSAKRRFSKHGQSGTKLHMIWGTMRQRCENPANRAYHRYGGRGITICQKWQSFAGFLEDMGPSWEDGMSLERIDVNGNYELSNCTWIPPKDQWKNRRSWEEWRKPAMLSTNTSGVKGVHKRGKVWCARISIKNKTHYLGSFVSRDAAAKAYKNAVAKRLVACQG